MRKYFLELFAIGLVDSEGRINSEHKLFSFLSVKYL